MRSILINSLVVIIVIVGITAFEISNYLIGRDDNISLFFGILAGIILIIPAVCFWKDKLEKLLR